MEKKELGLGNLISLVSRIRFNPRPWSNPDPTSISSKKIEVKEQSFIDFHAEIVKKVDALITEHEREQFFEELESTLERKIGLDAEKILTEGEKFEVIDLKMGNSENRV